ncbi:MAG: helix-turn-helix domain-containing protein [Gammaproteobacteria bacterium]|nr:helix-turn-helix domain-containing protein [Gammaproteobacteria bacterium]
MVNGYYTIREVAQKLQVTDETVRRWVRQRKLEASKVRSKGFREVWGVAPLVLEEFMEHDDLK